jgi:hypothetical protein
MESGNLYGYLDFVARDCIGGWAQDSADPERRVGLVITINGEVVGRILANQYRADLMTAAIGSGHHSFWVRIPGGLSPVRSYLIGVARELDGAELSGSPVLLEALGGDGLSVDTLLAKAVGDATGEANESSLLSSLVNHTHTLLQRGADREAQRGARAALATFQERWGIDLDIKKDKTELKPVLTRRALVVDDLVPDLSRDAGSAALLSHMRAIAALGYDVSFVAAQEMSGNAENYAQLELLGFHVWRAPHYVSVEDIIRRQSGGFDVVYLHRMSNAAKYMALVRHYLPQAYIVFSVADLHHLRLERQATIENRQDLKDYSRQVKLNEVLLAWSADSVITHSAEEYSILRKEIPAAKAHLVPWSIKTPP